MTAATKQEAALGKQILEHPSFPKILERIQARLFKRFIGATKEEREIISSIIDAQNLFLKELHIVVDEARQMEEAKPVTKKKTRKKKT